MQRLPLFALLIATCLFSCSKPNESKRPPVATGMQVRTLGAAPLSSGTLLAGPAGKEKDAPASFTPASSPRIAGRVTLRKESIFGREFLYSVATQASTSKSASHMSFRSNLMPATFLRVGSRLQIIRDTSLLHESELNQPHQLLQSLPILAEDAETITVEIRKASPYINMADTEDAINNKPLHSSWARSAEISPDGQVVLFETGLTTLEGNTILALESFFPRELFIPKEAKPIVMNPELNPLASRYSTMLAGSSWLDLDGKGKKLISLARRLVLPADRPIDFYLGRNTPEELIPYLTAGAEGWNRYSQKMWKRDLVKVHGLIPEGIKVGDPRFNLIYVHADPSADSAWSSKPGDPRTGIAPGSLIQIPSAVWEKFAESWKQSGAFSTNGNAGTTVENHPANHPFPGMSPKQLGLAKLKATVFHETGHSLGLHHNFKGSLSFDPDAANSPITSSIMDYATDIDYVGLFTSLDSSDGPILEYDRQAISFLYNEGKDILPADPVLPVCKVESEPTSASIDPFCAQFDSGKEPFKEVAKRLELFEKREAKLANFVSFPAALEIAANRFDALLAGSDKPGALARATAESLAQGYLFRIKSSLDTLERWYLPFDDNAYSSDEKELEDRRQALEILRTVLAVEKLSPDTKAALSQYGEALSSWLERNGHKDSLEPEKEKFAKLITDLEEDTLQGLKGKAFEGMTHREKILPYVNARANPPIDFAKEFVEILSKYTLASSLDSGTYFYFSKRRAAAAALHTYIASPQWRSEVEKVDLELVAQLKEAKSSWHRQQLNDLIRILRTGK